MLENAFHLLNLRHFKRNLLKVTNLVKVLPALATPLLLKTKISTADWLSGCYSNVRASFTRLGTAKLFYSKNLKNVSINPPLYESIDSLPVKSSRLFAEPWKSHRGTSRGGKVDVVKLPIWYDQADLDPFGLHGDEFYHAKEWAFRDICSWCWHVKF